METYNGWKNYETWNCALHFVDSFDGHTSKVTADEVSDYVYEYVQMYVKANIPFVSDVIESFVGAVDFDEIAKAINEANEIEDEDEG